MPERDWRFWLDKALSKSSLAALGVTGLSFLTWASTGNPFWAWFTVTSTGTWAALMYYLGSGSTESRAEAERRRRRERAVQEIERALSAFTPPRRPRERDEPATVFEGRRQQLRRIVRLEHLILTNLPSTSSGIDVLSPQHLDEVNSFADQAVDLSQRRVLLLRALHAHPRGQLLAELQELEARRQRASSRVASELEELIRLKRDQLEHVDRWREELQVAEINLDQIEAFLQSLAYDRTMTESNVGQRIARLQTRIQARQESLEEFQRRIGAEA